MRRMLLLASLVLFAASDARAEPGPTKEFADKNFKWALPSHDWKFLAVDAAQTRNGYVASAECRADGWVRAFVRVVSGGPSAEDIAEEVRSGTSAGLTRIDRSAVRDATLSGVPARLVAIAGTLQGGSPVWFRSYAATVDRTLYQLHIEAYKRAETKRGAEIDAMKRGFRLLKGAGPDEAPAAAEPVVEPLKPGEEGKAPAVFPPNGPKLEGRTAVFPSHNLRWSLPEGSPFAWSTITDDEKEPYQMLLAAVAQAERKTEDANEPQTNRAVVTLLVKPLGAGSTAAGVVGSPDVQDRLISHVFDGKVDSANTVVEAERKVGNHKGASVTLSVAANKQVRSFTLVTVCLRDVHFAFEVLLLGGDDVAGAFGPAVTALLDGIEFVQTKEHVRGPLAIAAIPPHTALRGKSADRELDFTIPGILGKKPKGLAVLEFKGEADADLRAAFEARAPDRQTYLYFDVHTYDAAELQKEGKNVAEFVLKRETEWEEGAGAGAVTVTKGQTPYFDTTFAGLKGQGYLFTATLDGHPFVEQGWLVKSKGSVLWIRMQLGGAAAEKTMDVHIKAIKKIKPSA